MALISTRAKWRLSTSGWSRVAKKYLTPPALSERRFIDSYDPAAHFCDTNPPIGAKPHCRCKGVRGKLDSECLALKTSRIGGLKRYQITEARRVISRHAAKIRQLECARNTSIDSSQAAPAPNSSVATKRAQSRN